MNRVFKNLAIYLLIVLIAVTVLRWSTDQPVDEKVFENLPEFMTAVEKGQIGELEITTYETYQELKGKTQDNKEFMLYAPVNFEALNKAVLEKNVNANQLETPKPSWFVTMLSSLLPILLLIGVFFFMMQQTQGGGNKVMQFGKSKAKLHTDEKEKITFADVAGVDEVKQELEEVVDFLKFPRRFTELGAKIPKGVLLFGPPGTGKTLLGRAVAGEAGVPFFSISGSDFVEMFVGVGASRVRDLFEQAKKNSPCIVFVDEIDAVGRQRGAGVGGGHDEREQTLNQLLVEMDGFNMNEGIIIIAATNRPDVLDPALLRPGRFDRQVAVTAPDVLGREEILQVHARDKPLNDSVDLKVIARSTPGFTGADLANLLNEAALLAARKDKKDISMDEVEESVERVIAGPEKKSRVINDFEKKIVSYHEAGHALVAELLPNCDPLHKVSIIPRGSAGGYTLLLPTEDRNYVTKSHLLEQVSMMLGGRIAEKLVLNEITTGAQNDLERVTNTVRKMITEWGMSDELGTITFGHKSGDQVFLGRDIARDRNYSEAVAFSIDKEVKKIIDERYKVAEKLLSDNIDKLHLIAQTLMEEETLDAVQFAKLMKGVTDSPKRTEDGETLTPTTKSAEDTINVDHTPINDVEDKDDDGGVIKITFKG